MSVSPITPTIPLDAPGLHRGFLRLPHARDDSAWGSVMIPIAVVKGGEGPTALLTGANHGDECEGPIALQALLHGLDPARVRGRVIVVPDMNLPAFRAVHRVSSIDGVNLNRAFPGDPRGTVTQKIAHDFDTELVPQADLVVDLHSGAGRSISCRWPARMSWTVPNMPGAAWPPPAPSTRPGRWSCRRSTRWACTTPPSRRAARPS